MPLSLHHFLSGSLTLFSIGLHLLFQVPVQNTCICNRGCSFLFRTMSDFRYRQSKQQFEALCSWVSILFYTSLSKTEPNSVLSLVLFLLPVSSMLCWFFVSITISLEVLQDSLSPVAAGGVCACHTAGSHLLLRHRWKSW